MPPQRPALAPSRAKQRSGALDNGPAAVDESPERRTTGAVRFVPVTLTVKRLDRSIEKRTPEFAAGRLLGARGMDIVRCGPGVDVYCHGGGLCVMRKTGLLEELLCDQDRSYFRRVAWDGRQLWAARHDGALWVIGMDGTVLAKVAGELGLPPSMDGPLLFPLAAGRVLALASFGDPPRAWAAEVSWSQRDSAAVRVFFEAKRSEPPGTPQSAPKESLDMGFKVFGVHVYQPNGKRERPVLLVQRNYAHPLQIDLKTLAVSVFPGEFKIHGTVSERIYFSHDGVLFVGWQPNLWLMAPSEQPWPGGKFLREIPLVNPAPRGSAYERMRLPYQAGYMNAGSYFDRPIFLDPGDGYVYFIGTFWHRIKLTTFTAERLTSTWMPEQYDECRNFGVSAHYGMVMWLEGTLYQIRIDETAIPHDGDAVTKGKG